MVYKVFVTEDENFVREGIRNFIESCEQYTLCGEAADGEMALPAILELRPDILITDIKMPFMDGLALSKAVKRAMPWIKIMIISGHNEFEFAKKAISIGVEDYILKPFSSKNLLMAMDKVVESIEAEKKRIPNEFESKTAEKQKKIVHRNEFIEKLLSGFLSTAEAVEGAEEFEIELLATKYVVAIAEIDYKNAILEAVDCTKDLVEQIFSVRRDAFWCHRGNDRIVIIGKEDSNKRLDSTIYEVVQTVQEDLQRSLQISATVYIGSIVGRIGEIPKSYKVANELMRTMPEVPLGVIVDYNDMKKGQVKDSEFIIEEPLGIKLRYATEQDIDNIIKKISQKFLYNGINSLLYRNYWLMDLVVESSRIVSELGGVPLEVFPELDHIQELLHMASSKDEMLKCAKDICKRLIVFKKGIDGLKYEDVITRAKEYVYENYSDSGISLNTVSDYTGFSPNHFSAIFSQKTGETFIEFLTRVRMEQSCKLFLETQEKTSDIAYMVGYNDSNYFRYLFKKFTGKSPRDFRVLDEK